MSDILIKEEKDKILTLTLNNPERLNILNIEMLEAIEVAFKEVENRDDIRVVVLTGEGKAFAAGADIKLMSQKDVKGAWEWALFGQHVFNTIESSSKPVIAAVNGYALGGGMELAMACDIVIASEKAVFGQPEVQLGLIPGFGGTQRLPRRVGLEWAKYLILSGERIDAHKAKEIGLVVDVVPHENLLERAYQIAKNIIKGSPSAISYAKQTLQHSQELQFTTGLLDEAKAFGLIFSTGEPQEGLKAFLEKRKPSWQE